MSYNIHVGNGGYLGWKILERTSEAQKTAFSKSAELQRSRDYFVENISKVQSAEDLIGDYKLLSVALRAFGLDDDLNNKFFIRKVLEANPQDENSIVSRLPDKRYANLNAAFGLWHSSSDDTNTLDAEAITDMFTTRSFEKNIGAQHQEIELALNAKRELAELAGSNISNDTKWLRIIGSKPLRKVFEGAFGLGQNFAKLPIDRQLSEFKAKAERLTGSSDIGQFTDGEQVESLLKRYLLRTQIDSSTNTSKFSTALTLLSAGRSRSLLS
ncbi:DUF1217 domain-containing protein [Paracoccus lutimaris]|uniref:Uncharacterized protein DUF1217 n=1 Tax=Paracoccus lutimaris TaxID=1490030 RepID=A0A368YPD1_9RHOB|nr:DUF1217 domain-containing protein [Paracoccus lutimaris]RCW80757.1 uncharacterized protein DUF1217 [Paracoccus lutimaris]